MESFKYADALDLWELFQGKNKEEMHRIPYEHVSLEDVHNRKDKNSNTPT